MLPLRREGQKDGQKSSICGKQPSDALLASSASITLPGYLLNTYYVQVWHQALGTHYRGSPCAQQVASLRPAGEQATPRWGTCSEDSEARSEELDKGLGGEGI